MRNLIHASLGLSLNLACQTPPQSSALSVGLSLKNSQAAIIVRPCNTSVLRVRSPHSEKKEKKKMFRRSTTRCVVGTYLLYTVRRHVCMLRMEGGMYSTEGTKAPRLVSPRCEKREVAVGLSLFRFELPRFSYFSSHGRALSEGGIGAAGFRVVRSLIRLFVTVCSSITRYAIEVVRLY